MKQKLKYLRFIASITVGGILLFQCYWVYNTYKTGEKNLNKLLTAILQRSIDNYQVKQVKLPSTLNGDSPYLNVVEWQNYSPAKAGQPKKREVDLAFNKVSVNADDIQNVKLIMAQLISRKNGSPVRLDLLNRFFTEELRKSNIDLPFKLLLLPHQQKLPENKISGYVSFSKESPVLEAQMEDTGRLLFIQNMPPAIISLMLILISAGSFFYMWIIIRKQAKLDGIKNDFINNITHELSTPLSILKSTHEILINFGEVEDRQKTIRYLKINTGILEKLNKNVERILDITQFENGIRLAKLEIVNIEELVPAIIERFKLKEDVEITFKSGEGLTTILTDGYIIDTVISNLIDNAIKYARGNSVVVIEASRFADDWQLTIKDNGKGVAKEHLPFVFDKFYRVPSGDLHDVKGYGLGLSYVKELVNSLNGKFFIKSKLNEGTLFIINFKTRE